MERPFIRGPTTPFRGQQRSPWLLTTYPSVMGAHPPSWGCLKIPTDTEVNGLIRSQGAAFQQRALPGGNGTDAILL